MSKFHILSKQYMSSSGDISITVAQREAATQCIDSVITKFLNTMTALITKINESDNIGVETLMCTMDVMTRIGDLTQGVEDLMVTIDQDKIAEFRCTEYTEKVQYVLKKLMPMYMALSLYSNEKNT